jgi:hypothetical protein
LLWLIFLFSANTGICRRVLMFYCLSIEIRILLYHFVGREFWVNGT